MDSKRARSEDLVWGDWGTVGEKLILVPEIRDSQKYWIYSFESCREGNVPAVLSPVILRKLLGVEQGEPIQPGPARVLA